jgi:hypothetical protein
LDKPTVVIDGTATVVRGNFNPAIFSADWFLRQGLINETESEASITQVVSPDLAVIDFGSISCQATREAIQFESDDIDESERVRDFCHSVMTLLKHTPITALGMNRHVHLQVADISTYHRIGDILMPKEFWSSFLNTPGLRTAVAWALRPDLYTGRIQVSIEPSFKVSRSVYIAYNDHYDLDVLTDPISGRDDPRFYDLRTVEASAERVPLCLEILSENWNAFMSRAQEAVDHVASLAEVSDG